MKEEYFNLLNDSRSWRSEMAEKGRKIHPCPDIENPELKEDTECMLGLMSEDSSVNNRDLYISSYVYPSLMTHNMVSIQPCSEKSFNICGVGGENWYEVSRINFNQIETIKIGKINTRLFQQGSIVSNIAANAVMAWDQFIIEQMEQSSGIRNYVFSMWGGSIADQMSNLKDNVETNSHLPVTWVIINRKILTVLEGNGNYSSYEEEKRYVSGYLAGRWRNADVYCVEELPRDTVAIMGYKGNISHDAGLVVGINKVINLHEGRKNRNIYGRAEILSGLGLSQKAIGKLKIT